MTITNDSNAAFVGSVPEIYERYLGPMFMAPCARDLAQRIKPRLHDVLELACGTGILTRELLRVLGPEARLTSTDLNEPMIAAAQQHVSDSRVRWQQADAMALPFDRESFDAVVCQFGVMFFPDKVQAAAQVQRTLRRGGVYVFNTWGTHADNPIARVSQRVIEECFPQNAPMFYQVPWSYADPNRIKADMSAAGFARVDVDVRELVCTAESAEQVAIGIVQGNPMVYAIRERGTPTVEEVTTRVTDAMQKEFGNGRINTTMRELVVQAS